MASQPHQFTEVAQWHDRPRARSILAGLRRDDFKLVSRYQLNGPDYTTYEPMTTAAERAVATLKGLAEAEVSASLGYTFGGVMEPYDREKSRRWIEAFSEIDSVEDVLAERFGAPARQRVTREQADAFRRVVGFGLPA